MALLLEIDGICKGYGVPVLRSFDLSLEAGEVHALVGGNGAGKSTLARILSGLIGADFGEMRLEGVNYQPRSRMEAQAAGVTLMLQELSGLPTLSVAENLFLSRLPSRFGWVDRVRLEGASRVALERVGFEAMDPWMPLEELGIGQRQMVELAAALDQRCRVLILDEPTAALSSVEAATLFAQIRRLRSEGVCVIYISHRMEELRGIADRVSVLRDGQCVGTFAMQDISTQELIAMMSSRGVEGSVEVDRKKSERVVLGVEGLCSRPLVEDVSFELREGEILGLSGLVGAGRSRTLRAMYGASPVDAGRMEVEGRLIRWSDPAQAVEAGLGLVPEDRKEQGLLLDGSVLDNLMLASLGGFWFEEGQAVRDATPILARLEVKCEGVDQAVGALSGGNQQKVILGRWLLRSTRILLLDEPTRGIDASAKEVIYGLLRELVAEGKSVVMVSSELPELMRVCDRIVVLSAGRVAGEFSRGEWTSEGLMEAAFRYQKAEDL